MAQIQQKKDKNQLNEFLKPITVFLAKLTNKEKISYGLILIGILLIIIGIILW